MSKILFIASGSSVGGGEKNLFDVARQVSKDYQVSVVIPLDGILADKLKEVGCKVYICGLKLLSLKQYIKILKAEKPDLVHIQGLRASFIGRVASRLVGIPCIFTVHGLHYLYYKNPVKKWLYLLGDKLLKRWTDGYICVSSSVFDQVANVVKVDKNKVWLIHNGIDFEKYTLNKKPDNKNNKTITCIGRLQEPKGQVYLLKAIPLIKEKIDNFECLIVGDGPDRQKLEQYADEHDLKNVIFVGESNNIPKLMLGSDILVMPSLWEGFPYVLLEAMAAGLPVVATNVGGIPEIVVDGETGILVPPKNEKALTEAVIKLLNDPELRAKMGEAGRKRALEKFTLDSMLKKTTTVYKKVLGQSIDTAEQIINEKKENKTNCVNL